MYFLQIKVSANPSANAPTIAPFRLPIPPQMLAIQAFMVPYANPMPI